MWCAVPELPWLSLVLPWPCSGCDSDSSVCLQEHCLMGIKGTVRRSTDGDFIHANVDIDLIITEEPEIGNIEKPVEIFHIIEHFCLGRRRLHLFGRDSTIRPGNCCLGFAQAVNSFQGPKEVPRSTSQVRQQISRRYVFGVCEDLSVTKLLFGKFDNYHFCNFSRRDVFINKYFCPSLQFISEQKKFHLRFLFSHVFTLLRKVISFCIWFSTPVSIVLL